MITIDEHKRIHQELHKSLDKLVSDFIYHQRDKNLSDTTIIELIYWSYNQTISPTEEEELPPTLPGK